MAAGPWIATNTTRSKLLTGQFVLADSWKMAIYLSTSNLTVASTTYAGVTNESGTTNTGYTTGGIAVEMTQSGTTTVTVVMTTAPVWTAGSANLVGKWAAIYEVGGDVAFFCLLEAGGADVTATSGNTLTIGSNGGTVFTLA
jgi:hypothetical protein